MSASTFGELLRERLVQCGYRQAVLATLLGVDEPVVSRWCTGKRRPDRPLFARLLDEVCDTPEQRRALVDAWVQE